MRNKDLQRLLSTFPDDLVVYEVGAWTLEPITDVSERRSKAGPYLAMETAPRPTETAEEPKGNPGAGHVHLLPPDAI